MHSTISVCFPARMPNIKVSGSARQEAYDNLESWLRLHASKHWDMSQTRVFLGPNGSYFAVSPAGGAVWASIPARLEALIDLNQPGRTPTLVALGVKGTWFALWQDGSSSCNLDSEYQKLEDLLRRHGKSGVKVSPSLRRVARLSKGTCLANESENCPVPWRVRSVCCLLQRWLFPRPWARLRSQSSPTEHHHDLGRPKFSATIYDASSSMRIAHLLTGDRATHAAIEHFEYHISRYARR